MRQIRLSMLIATVLFTVTGCEPDYCSCSYKPQPIARVQVGWPNEGVWCPVGDPENDARIIKLLSDRCIRISLLRPWRNSGLQPIDVVFTEQEKCAEKLLFEAATRGEITVVFGHPRSTIYRRPSTGPLNP